MNSGFLEEWGCRAWRGGHLSDVVKKIMISLAIIFEVPRCLGRGESQAVGELQCLWVLGAVSFPRRSETGRMGETCRSLRCKQGGLDLRHIIGFYSCSYAFTECLLDLLEDILPKGGPLPHKNRRGENVNFLALSSDESYSALLSLRNFVVSQSESLVVRQRHIIYLPYRHQNCEEFLRIRRTSKPHGFA